MELRGKNILIVSPESWGTSRLSKHHYAIALADRGNQVYFLNPPNQNREPISETVENKSIYILNYQNRVRGLRFLPRSFRKRIARSQLREIESITKQKFDIIWSFDPSRHFGIKSGSVFRIYHAVDFVPEEIFMKAIEDGDLILSVSKELVPSPLRSSAHVIGHGTVSQDLPGKKISLPGSNKIKALYAGNLLIPYLNRPLILKLVQDYLSVDFIFCGSTGKGNLNPNPLISDESWIAELQNHENVSLLGELNSDKLFNHLFAADILLCAYDHDRYPERIVNSHKILEYLMTGNTIVSTLLPAYPDDLVHQCTNAEEFLHCFSEVLQSLESENSANLQSERREFAKKFTYENQLIRIEKIMADG